MSTTSGKHIDFNNIGGIAVSMTEEDFEKSFPKPAWEVYDDESLDHFTKSLWADDDASLADIEKAQKDISKLQRKIITDKNGKVRTVYVKPMETKKASHPSDKHAQAVEVFGNKKRYMSKLNAHDFVTRHYGAAEADYARDHHASNTKPRGESSGGGSGSYWKPTPPTEAEKTLVSDYIKNKRDTEVYHRQMTSMGEGSPYYKAARKGYDKADKIVKTNEKALLAAGYLQAKLDAAVTGGKDISDISHNTLKGRDSYHRQWEKIAAGDDKAKLISEIAVVGAKMGASIGIHHTDTITFVAETDKRAEELAELYGEAGKTLVATKKADGLNRFLSKYGNSVITHSSDKKAIIAAMENFGVKVKADGDNYKVAKYGKHKSAEPQQWNKRVFVDETVTGAGSLVVGDGRITVDRDGTVYNNGRSIASGKDEANMIASFKEELKGTKSAKHVDDLQYIKYGDKWNNLSNLMGLVVTEPIKNEE